MGMTMKDFNDRLRQLEATTQDWHRVMINRSTRSATIEDLTMWLDDNCTGSYYFNTYNIQPRAPVEVRFLLEEDAVFFQMSWSSWEGP
jgi:hypothetical protein